MCKATEGNNVTLTVNCAVRHHSACVMRYTQGTSQSHTALQSKPGHKVSKCDINNWRKYTRKAVKHVMLVQQSRRKNTTYFEIIHKECPLLAFRNIKPEVKIPVRQILTRTNINVRLSPTRYFPSETRIIGYWLWHVHLPRIWRTWQRA